MGAREAEYFRAVASFCARSWEGEAFPSGLVHKLVAWYVAR